MPIFLITLKSTKLHDSLQRTLIEALVSLILKARKFPMFLFNLIKSIKVLLRATHFTVERKRLKPPIKTYETHEPYSNLYFSHPFSTFVE